MSQSHLDLAIELANRFEQIGIRYVVGGSVASSLVGEPRSTVDIDIAVELTAPKLAALIESVEPTFYVPHEAAHRAVLENDSFNMIHNDAALKADLFVLGKGTLDANQLARRQQVLIPTDPPAHLWITSAEDQILRKLDWYKRGGSVSDRQWRDVVAIININEAHLDDAYLDATAEIVDLGLLLRSARLAAKS